MAQSPAERGSADAYYSRRPHPHKWLDNLGLERVDELTETERKAYEKAYWAEDDRKDWGEE